MKRFNDWPAAIRAAVALHADTGYKFRVQRAKLPLYGWYWWEVTPA